MALERIRFHLQNHERKVFDMNTFGRNCPRWVAGSVVMVALAGCGRENHAAILSSTNESTSFVSRADSPPRKVTVASALVSFSGPVEARLAQMETLAEEAAVRAGEQGLDLLVFPEFSLMREGGDNAETQAVSLAEGIGDKVGKLARRHQTWLVVPMVLQEADPDRGISNAAVLFDREGAVAGIYRKAFPIVDEQGGFEGGVTPGDEIPVFETDFGRLGILICWDMGYEAIWDGLAAGGAEIVVLPSASPQTLRPMAQALRHHYYVLTSTLKDNASLVDPIGRILEQQVTAPGVLVHRIDLAFAILHWSENLRGGEMLRARYGERVGYDYSSREDTGVFWSNDPELTIGEMIEANDLQEMPDLIEKMRAAKSIRE